MPSRSRGAAPCRVGSLGAPYQTRRQGHWTQWDDPASCVFGSYAEVMRKLCAGRLPFARRGGILERDRPAPSTLVGRGDQRKGHHKSLHGFLCGRICRAGQCSSCEPITKRPLEVFVLEEIKKTQFPMTRKGVTYDLEFETEHVRAVRATLGTRSWYEVFERRVNAAREIDGVKIGPSEAFPNDEAFGKWAFVCETPRQVSDRASEILNKILAREFKRNNESGGAE